jgi:hypothetical protein
MLVSHRYKFGFVARRDAIDAQLRSRAQRGGGLEIDPLVDARLEIGR